MLNTLDNSDRPAAPPSVRAYVPFTYFTATQAAQYFQVTKDWLYRKARAGVIPAARVGREFRFKREDLDGWFAAQVERVAFHGQRRGVGGGVRHQGEQTC